MGEKVTRAAIGLVKRRDRYLICQRHPGGFFGGCWEFPGGKREVGESWEMCLRRELREELGIAIKAIRPFGRMRYRYAGGCIIFQVFRCAIAKGEPRPLDAAALHWVKPHQLPRYRFPPANRRLITQLAREGEAKRGSDPSGASVGVML